MLPADQALELFVVFLKVSQPKGDDGHGQPGYLAFLRVIEEGVSVSPLSLVPLAQACGMVPPIQDTRRAEIPKRVVECPEVLGDGHSPLALTPGLWWVPTTVLILAFTLLAARPPSTFGVTILD